MSDWDEQSSMIWPDADARAERRAALHNKLDQYLEGFVESPDGGWAQASHEDITGLHWLYKEIADLKFQRDSDGDSVINFHIVGRNHGRLASVFVPYSPSLTSPDATSREKLTWLREATSAHSILASEADAIMRSISSMLAHDEREESDKDRRRAKLATVEKALRDSHVFEDALALIETLNTEFKDDRSSDMEALRTIMRDRFPLAIKSYRTDIDNMMLDDDIAYRDDFDSIIRPAVRAAGRIFGATTFATSNRRFNYLSALRDVQRHSAAQEKWKTDTRARAEDQSAQR